MLVVAQWVDRGSDGLIMWRTFYEKEIWMSGNQREWSRIGVNGGGFVRGNACGITRVMSP